MIIAAGQNLRTGKMLAPNARPVGLWNFLSFAGVFFEKLGQKREEGLERTSFFLGFFSSCSFWKRRWRRQRKKPIKIPHGQPHRAWDWLLS